MGKPVIATDIRGCREEVIHGITGLLVPSKDSLKLEMAIEQIMADKELAKKMGDEGQKRANNLFIENKIVDLQISMIRKLVIKGS